MQDCASGICDRLQHQCISPKGLLDACEANEECASGSCLKMAEGSACSHECTADADCEDGYCWHSVCSAPCTASADYEVCVDGRLLPCSDPKAAAADCNICGCSGGKICQASQCVTNPREHLATANVPIENISLINGYIYWSGRQPAGAYSTDQTFVAMELPSSGGVAQLLGTLPNQRMDVVATDADAYYFQVWAKTDPTCCNVWQGDIYRVARGTTTMTLLASAQLNDPFLLIGQTPTALYFQIEGSTGPGSLQRNDLPGGSGALNWFSNINAYARQGWSEGEIVRFVGYPSTSSGSPTFYSLDRTTGLTQGATIPNLCVQVTRDTVHGRWLGICGTEPWDVTVVTEAGTVTPIAKGTVRGFKWYDSFHPQVHGNTLYWLDSDVVTYTRIRGVDLTTRATKTIELQATDDVFGMDDGYVYFANNTEILRTALSSATTP
jgi:hypothetical protein